MGKGRAFIPTLLFLLSFFIITIQGKAKSEVEIPRTILILYYAKTNIKEKRIRLGQILESPLNHLGLVIEYHNMAGEIPNLEARQDVRGILTWYVEDSPIANPRAYVNWLIAQVKSGKKLVIMERPGFFNDENSWATREEDVKNLFSLLGVEDQGNFLIQTLETRISYKNPNLLEFERRYKSILPEGDIRIVKNVDAEVHLILEKDGMQVPLIVTNENGAFVSDGYALYADESENNSYRAWYLNPFEFFRKAFALEDQPIPDTTTLVGNRLYYSHIDGDGWNNITQLEAYKKKETLCSEVLLQKVFLPYPDLPVSVGPIAADLDPLWEGTPKSTHVARQILKLPHIEVASHTYSHPFSWEFFKDKNNKQKEIKFFPYYPSGYTWTSKKKQSGVWGVITNNVDKIFKGKGRKKTPEGLKIGGVYDVPRGFAHFPFKLKKEIQGSCDYITSYAPAAKKTEIILWSGDTSPFPKALELAVKAGVQNMNGGDTRFDEEKNSYAFVSPKGKYVTSPYSGKKLWQVYTSSANETIYTRTWRERFYSYRKLVDTFENTESPIRINPLNIYYHTYIGEKEASLQALIDNLEYVRARPFCPISASHYAKIVQSFYKVKVIPDGGEGWIFKDRGDLQTIRFDKAVLKGVDFNRSEGVLGQRHFQGSLYVFLDPSIKSPKVVLKEIQAIGAEAPEPSAYLIESHWPLRDLNVSNEAITFTSSGYGKGSMTWKVPKSGVYSIKVRRGEAPVHETQAKTNEQQELNFSLPVDAIVPVEITMSYEGRDV